MICYILSFLKRSLTLKVCAFSEKSLSKDLIINQISYCPFTLNLFDFQQFTLSAMFYYEERKHGFVLSKRFYG
jgi:hypothetical protein